MAAEPPKTLPFFAHARQRLKRSKTPLATPDTVYSSLLRVNSSAGKLGTPYTAFGDTIIM